MTKRRYSTLHEAATQLIGTLRAGHGVTLEITSQDEATGGLLCLITAIHETAKAHRVGVSKTPIGERGLRLRLAEG